MDQDMRSLIFCLTSRSATSCLERQSPIVTCAIDVACCWNESEGGKIGINFLPKHHKSIWLVLRPNQCSKSNSSLRSSPFCLSSGAVSRSKWWQGALNDHARERNIYFYWIILWNSLVNHGEIGGASWEFSVFVAERKREYIQSNHELGVLFCSYVANELEDEHEDESIVQNLEKWMHYSSWILLILRRYDNWESRRRNQICESHQQLCQLQEITSWSADARLAWCRYVQRGWRAQRTWDSNGWVKFELFTTRRVYGYDNDNCMPHPVLFSFRARLDLKVREERSASFCLLIW